MGNRLVIRAGGGVYLTAEQKALCKKLNTSAGSYERGALKCAQYCAAYRDRKCPVQKVFSKLAYYEELEAGGKLAKVKHGEWLKFSLGEHDFVDRYKCSLCGNIVLPTINHIDNFLYCSKCGSKMEFKGGAAE